MKKILCFSGSTRAGEKTFESLALILKTIQCKISGETMLHLKGVRAKMLSGELAEADALTKLDGLFTGLLNLAS